MFVEQFYFFVRDKKKFCQNWRQSLKDTDKPTVVSWKNISRFQLCFCCCSRNKKKLECDMKQKTKVKFLLVEVLQTFTTTQSTRKRKLLLLEKGTKNEHFLCSNKQKSLFSFFFRWSMLSTFFLFVFVFSVQEKSFELVKT